MPTLATLITMTTYGTWLRGDHRGWVDEGKIYPADPVLQSADRQRMADDLWIFDPAVVLPTGRAMVRSLRTRLALDVRAFTLQRTHSHFVIAATDHSIPAIVKCAKDAARYHLRPGRPIWTTDYDKRFCFDESSLHARMAYVHRHNTQNRWPPDIFLTDI